MTLLNQIIAVLPGAKATAERDFTDIYQRLGKPTLLSGMTRNYQPIDAEDPELPSETTLVQLDVETVLGDARKALSRLFDARATLDWANCEATADIVVDGSTLLPDVPVTYLLFLEKSLVNLHTFVKKLPILDPAEQWHRDDNVGAYVTEPEKSLRFVKVRRNHVKAEATDKHPAQVEMYMEETPRGTWNKKKLSGALPEKRRRELLDRIDKLNQAVKFAREKANSTEIYDQKIAKFIFDYLFA